MAGLRGRIKSARRSPLPATLVCRSTAHLLRRDGQQNIGLKGDRNAYEEIRADSTGADFIRRMRSRVGPDRICTSAAGVCASPNAAATTSPQSIQSQCRASTELQTHNAFNTKHRSK